MPPKNDAKKQLEQCRASVIQTRNQKKVAEAEQRALEEQIRANSNEEKAKELEVKLGALKTEMAILSEGYDELEKELADREREFKENYGEETVMMSMDTLTQLAEMLNKQPKRDEMMDKFSEIYSHQRKTDIPLFDGIVSKEKLIEDWLREGQRVARTAGWSPEMKLRMFSDRLTKMALRFHEELIKRKPNLTFAEWKKEMKAGFKNDAEIERRKKELSNFKQTPSHRVRDFISLIDEQYIRAYGKKLAESNDPDVVQLRENTKKDIVYKGLLPPIAEELWHRTSASTTYEELIKLAKEVEEILNRKALLRPETTINNVAKADGLDEDFDGLTIDELNSSSQIDNAPNERQQSLAPLSAPWENRGFDTCSRYTVNSVEARSSQLAQNRSRPPFRGFVNEYRPGAKPDTPVSLSRHSLQQDYPERSQQQNPSVRRQLNFDRLRSTEESSSKPCLLRRTSGYQASSSPGARDISQRSSGRDNGNKHFSLPKDYKYSDQTYRSFRSNRFTPYGSRSESHPRDSRNSSAEGAQFSGKCYGCGTEGHIRRNCPQSGDSKRDWPRRRSN